ncbi:unnamed protein product [Cylicostephanus goldi]|uniref:C-type lectin domain-containing protein n=1 Tax=Cylicostephanus goldi TaxID=71465 RepID=A0A3P6TG09_CYLGO|nr:unnamed protein product [Cylicostephanus goldi]
MKTKKNRCGKKVKRIRFERPHSFDDAENRCRVFKGHLTSIHSYLENEFVERIAENGTFAGKSDRLSWIGLKRSKGNKTWHWTDGSPYGYNKWAGQPESENKTEEKCAQVITVSFGTFSTLRRFRWYPRLQRKKLSSLKHYGTTRIATPTRHFSFAKRKLDIFCVVKI